MENNNAQNTVPTPEPVLPPQPVTPQSVAPQGNNSAKKIVLFLVALGIIVLLGAGYVLYSNKPAKTYNATVYNQPSIAPSVSPIPSVYAPNPKDTSNQALNQDSQSVDQSVNALNSDVNSVDQSFNDQQTNLQ